MTARYRVHHETHYDYSAEVGLGFNRSVLTPRRTPTQTLVAAELTVDPPADTVDRTRDLFGNEVVVFSVERPHRHLTVVHTSEVVLRDARGQGTLEALTPWEEAAAALGAVRGPDRALGLPTALTPVTEDVVDLARRVFRPGRPLLDAATELTQLIHREFTYRPGSTTVSTPITEVLRTRTGVCQDFAHLALACLRAVGLGGRYLSGYLETSPPPGRPKLVGADASHAWCAVRLAAGTWLDLDPTNDLVGPNGHVVVGHGRDYRDVAPLSGVIIAGRVVSRLQVRVDVTAC